METYRMIKHHIDADMLAEKHTSLEEVVELITSDTKVVTYETWSKIDTKER